MFIKKNLKPVYPFPGKNLLYSKISFNQTSSVSSSTSGTDVLSECYMYLSHISDPSTAMEINCKALALAKEIISSLQDEPVTFRKGQLPESFYKKLTSRISGLYVENDADIITIHLKQTVIILKNAGIISQDKGKAVITGMPASAGALYSSLFNSFWNTTPWEKIFPSNEESAKELQRNRNIFKDLLLKNGRTSISKTANDFFDLTGFASYNDMFHISFIDFYLITWLSHFGIIKLHTEKPDSPVQIELTEKGNSLLNSLS